MGVKTSKATERKYYKYDDTNLVNVAIADNAIVGAEISDSIANAFNGSAVVGVWCECWIDRNTSISGIAYIGQQNLTQKIKKINFWQGGYGLQSINCNVSSLKIQISEDGTNWTDVQTVAVNNGTASSTTCYFTEITVNDYVVPSTPYQMRLLANSGVIHGNNAGWFINEVEFYADSIIEGTPEDYDFYKDIDTYKAIYDTERKYYKYINEAWVKPTLTSNTSYGTITASTGSASAYALFNGDAYTIAYNGGTFSAIWELPHEVTFNTIQFRPHYVYPSTYSITYFYFDVWQNDDWVNLYTGGNFGASYASLVTANITPTPTNKIRIRLYPYTGGAYSSRVDSVAFFGTAKTGVEEGTESDYDFYKDIDTYKVVEVS